MESNFLQFFMMDKVAGKMEIHTKKQYQHLKFINAIKFSYTHTKEISMFLCSNTELNTVVGK